MIDYYETKEHPVTKKMVIEAYKEIRSNGKAAGVDGVSLESYAKNLQGNLYKLWNRLTSGSYFPQHVREKQIPKKEGGSRMLGIPTVEDRVAQQVVKAHLEKKAEVSFHPDSYGYRRRKHAHDAIERARKRCWENDWVIDLDIQSFFDSIDHEMMLKAVQWYTKEKWVLMYIERWLKAGMLKEDGKTITRENGTPQGGVISPLLANIFLHFAFDKWMERNYPYITFERYCDDIIVHCKSQSQAMFIRDEIAKRLENCKLTLSAKKTKIVYCKNSRRREKHDSVSFDFLGYTFAPKMCRIKGNNMLNFKPAMSRKSKKSVMEKLRSMSIHKSKENILQLAERINLKVRGWMNYYCAFDRWSTAGVWWQLNRRIIKWAMWNKKKTVRKAVRWLQGIYRTKPGLFAHWKIAHL